ITERHVRDRDIAGHLVRRALGWQGETLRVGKGRVPGEILEEGHVDNPVVDAQCLGDAPGRLDLTAVRLPIVHSDGREVVALSAREGRDGRRIQPTAQEDQPEPRHANASTRVRDGTAASGTNSAYCTGVSQTRTLATPSPNRPWAASNN